MICSHTNHYNLGHILYVIHCALHLMCLTSGMFTYSCILKEEMKRLHK